MEWILSAIVITQAAAFTYASHLMHRHHRSLLNAVIAKTPQEFERLEKRPTKRPKKSVPVQDDAGIPFGL